MAQTVVPVDSTTTCDRCGRGPLPDSGGRTWHLYVFDDDPRCYDAETCYLRQTRQEKMAEAYRRGYADGGGEKSCRSCGHRLLVSDVLPGETGAGGEAVCPVCWCGFVLLRARRALERGVVRTAPRPVRRPGTSGGCLPP